VLGVALAAVALLAGETVVIDPGHNGANGAHPAEINRQVAIGGGRNNRGVGPCIDERARIGNRAGADAAVSIHADGGPPGGRGFHVIYPTRIEGLTDDIFAPSRRLARVLRGAYEERTGLPRSTYVGGSGIVQRSDLGGLRLSDVPKVFIETGNMRNAADAAILESRRGRRRIAHGIADGVRRFLGGQTP
jgi:N-acetylmuramoyl-L-alanine amidase